MLIRRCACRSRTRSSWRSTKRGLPRAGRRRRAAKIFSKYNLDVEFVNFGNSTDVLLEAIATGKADAGVGMALRWLKALEQGFDVKLTAGTHGGCLNLLTAKASPFNGLESLKGQTIGVTDMAGPDKTSSPSCLSATVSIR